MKPSPPGKNTSAIEVTHISSDGIWLFAHHEEFFMSDEDFPWFKDRPVRAILNVEELSPERYHCPTIDIDLTREIIKNPGRFPLEAKITE
ncbi:MAG: integron cassette protein [Chlorobi bacterium]|nr:integron cassette protein [Chlorobiota bacterium]